MNRVLLLTGILFFTVFVSHLMGQAGMPARYGTYPRQITYFLANPAIQKEMELSSEQKKLIADLNKQLREGYAELYKKYPNIRDPKTDYKKRAEMFKQLNAAYATLGKQHDDQIVESLVPRQMTVLKKLQFNSSVQFYGISTTLSQDPFKSDLETTSEQIEKINRIKKETEAEIQKLIEEKRKLGREKMLKILNAKQLKKIREYEKEARKAPYTRL